MASEDPLTSTPMLPRHGATAEDAKACVRAAWRRALALPFDLPIDDSASFQSLGGDALAFTAATALAAELGVQLVSEKEVDATESVDAFVKNARGWRGEHWVRPERQERRRKTMLALRAGCSKAAHPQQQQLQPQQKLQNQFVLHESSIANLTPGGKRAVERTILERDGRNTDLPLRPLGGLSACAAGDLETARWLANSGESSWLPAHAADRHGSTALMWAAGAGHLHVVQWLVDEIGVPVDAKNKERRTALMWACKTGQRACALYLLDRGADPNLRMKDDSTAFDWAVHSGSIETMECLAARVDLHAINKFGCSAVLWAAASGQVDALKWLQAHGLKLDAVNPARHGAVAKAAWRGQRSALEWLLVADDGPRLSSQLDLTDHDGRDVAHLARQNGKLDVAQWLQGLIDARRGAAKAPALS